METKKEIRKRIKALKAELKREEIEKLSSQIAKNMIESEVYKNADVIYPYVAYNQEVITDEIIEDAWKNGKKVAVPKVLGDIMEFFYIESFDELENGYFDIPEPKETKNLAKGSKNVLIIMPGLAFDRDFGRIGYGGGFYDKYLDSHPETTFAKVALTYDFQILEHVETEAHDYKVDAIITPTEVISK